MNFQIVEINTFYKIILGKARLGVTLEFRDGFVQPDRLSQIELIAYFVQSAKDLVGAGIVARILDAGILKHMIILKSSCP